MNNLTVKSAAHDVDIGKNSDDLRKLERQRIEAGLAFFLWPQSRARLALFFLTPTHCLCLSASASLLAPSFPCSIPPCPEFGCFRSHGIQDNQRHKQDVDGIYEAGLYMTDIESVSI